ncbi:MAG: nitroreductase family protein [Saprospiraceae bacterium]|nr:nitroreductase family protein [Saprospiraceae bacterium]MBK7811036.1 nitroreductase family protein [Saprospiraceae bacterium]MBK9630639.1 nitroreductase family protein [Saprospiraceae bacterium]
MNQLKKAHTKYPVLELIQNRWSARSFRTDKDISMDDLYTLIEAGSWAASSSNEQPWKFILAPRGSEQYQKVYDALMDGNKPWCKNAAAFIVCLIRTQVEKTGKDNFYAMHDLGLANSHILLQATSMDIACHPMAGIDKNKLIEVFNIPEGIKPAVVIALGYLDEAQKLEEPFLTRELTPRNRKSLEEIIM